MASLPGRRLASLDAFRGFVILAMIWVNYIAGMPGIPYWLEHAGAQADGITLPDLVFPAFLFMAGMAVPLALRRDAAGGLTLPLLGRLLWRAGSLMVAGVVLAEAWRYDEAAALLPRALYFTLFYGAMLLLWRQGAPDGNARGWPFWLGALLMAALLALFRGKTGEGAASVYLQHSWWGILGMIGWAYLVCGVLYLAVRGRDAALWGCLLLLLALYMGGTDGWLPLPAALNGFVNVPQVLGSTSANMMAGVLAGRILLARPPGAAGAAGRALPSLAALALALLVAGLLLRPFYGINKIHATAPYSLVCAGVTLALFMVFYWLCDVKGWRRWCAWLVPAGGNALFAYIVPDMWEQLAALLHVPRFWWPMWRQGGAAGLLNAAILALAMIGLAAGAARAGVKLKM